MTNKDKYDIFVCGGSNHVGLLKALLPKLRPCGFVHVASTIMKPAEEAELEPLCDAFHRPNYPEVATIRLRTYRTFQLFCIREINRLATRPHFIKMDADAELADDWIRYVDDGFAAHPDAAIFGNRRGIPLNLHLSGPPVRERLGADLHLDNLPKVCGPFYACRTDFFKSHNELMQKIHELCFCFKHSFGGQGVRRHPSPLGLPDTVGRVRKNEDGLRNSSSEDGTRCTAVHAAGGEVLSLPSGGLIGQERN